MWFQDWFKVSRFPRFQDFLNGACRNFMISRFPGVSCEANLGNATIGRHVAPREMNPHMPDRDFALLARPLGRPMGIYLSSRGNWGNPRGFCEARGGLPVSFIQKTQILEIPILAFLLKMVLNRQYWISISILFVFDFTLVDINERLVRYEHTKFLKFWNQNAFQSYVLFL